MADEKREAEATVRFALEGALALTAHLTKLNCTTTGPVVDALMDALRDPQYAWAFRELFQLTDTR